jgi:AraC family transcriptional regulator of adaptative response/methylated-DNA-[protein]-cysteine methyltransferase
MSQETKYWKAVEQRDSTFDGRFVYAVRSTGVYCRPSCPSRRPLRKGVLFFPAPGAAEHAGFRACRRCQGKPAGESLGSRVCRYVDAHLKDEARITLAALSAAFQVSPYHLQRTFKRTVGVSPREYAEARRLGLWKSRLRQGRDVTTALYEAGYGSSSRLYEKASARLGMTPAVYRKGGKGMKIDYVIANCALGRLLVAFTERGVSAVYLGDQDAVMESALRAEYPNAEIRRGQSVSWVNELLAYLRGSHTKLYLPLDLAASAFQMQVWAELQHIPYGSTRTYSQIAQRMGRPTAARAIARACASNPVSLVVPCHRVVREDGNLAGYRWGVARKQALLERERA